MLTEKQKELLKDKLDLWRRASVEGAVSSRDYNRRAAAALEALMREAGYLDENP